MGFIFGLSKKTDVPRGCVFGGIPKMAARDGHFWLVQQKLARFLFKQGAAFLEGIPIKLPPALWLCIGCLDFNLLVDTLWVFRIGPTTSEKQPFSEGSLGQPCVGLLFFLSYIKHLLVLSKTAKISAMAV